MAESIVLRNASFPPFQKPQNLVVANPLIPLRQKSAQSTFGNHLFLEQSTLEAGKIRRKVFSVKRSLAKRALAGFIKPLHVGLVIADDQPIFRNLLRHLLEAEPDYKVIGEASDGAEAVKLVRQLKPDILLLDDAMPKYDGM
jgi:PleD family two-component response regulator